MHHTLTRRSFLRNTISAVFVTSGAGGIRISGGGDARPNIVFLYTDQQHGFTLAGNGDNRFEVPRMRELASGGMTFANFFCATPQCSPSRASLMTGQYPHRTGVITNEGMAFGRGIPLNPALPSIGSVFQRAGYDTRYYGKWHLGGDPRMHGWTEYKNGKDAELTAFASRYLSSKPSSPFFLFVSYLDPHDIYRISSEAPSDLSIAGIDLPRSFDDDISQKPAPQSVFMEDDQGEFIKDWDREAWKRYRAFYRGKVKKVDAEIGKVIDSLKKSGCDKNTIIVMTSDHGDMDTAHRLVFKGPFMYEELVRIPGMIPAGAVREQTVQNIDVLPTLCEFAGIKTDHLMDGRSMVPVLEDVNAPGREFVFMEYYAKQSWITPFRSIRTNEWKYNLYLKWGEELYDMRHDPIELHNRAGDLRFREIKDRMLGMLRKEMKETDDYFEMLKPTDRHGVPVS